MVAKVTWYVAEFLLQLGHVSTAEKILLALHERLAQVGKLQFLSIKFKRIGDDTLTTSY